VDTYVDAMRGITKDLEGDLDKDFLDCK